MYPEFIRIVQHKGGAIRRWLLFLIFRWVVKPVIHPGFNLSKFHALNAWFDRHLARIDPSLQRNSVLAGGVRADWLTPPNANVDRVICYLHGGAFISYLPRIQGAMAGRWGKALNARVLMVDYRLAPDHPYPAAPDDCLAAYRFLLEQGILPANIVIAGDSAGATLTLSTLMRIKAAGLPQPACAVALSPLVDFTLTSPSLLLNGATDPMFNPTSFATVRNLYVAPEHLLNPDVSPLFGDWHSLPPIFFQSSHAELLCDESVRGALRAHEHGVHVEVELWEDMPHIFQALDVLPQSKAAWERIEAFIRRHTAWG